MFKMSPSASTRTGRQTTPPLVDGVVHNRLVQFAPHGDQSKKSDARAARRRPRNK